MHKILLGQEESSVGCRETQGTVDRTMETRLFDDEVRGTRVCREPFAESNGHSRTAYGSAFAIDDEFRHRVAMFEDKIKERIDVFHGEWLHDSDRGMVNGMGNIPSREMISRGKRAEWSDGAATGFGNGDEDFAGAWLIAVLNRLFKMNGDGNFCVRSQDAGFGPLFRVVERRE